VMLSACSLSPPQRAASPAGLVSVAMTHNGHRG